MSKIQIENDEDALNDYLKNFNKENNETDLFCLKSFYFEAINFIKEKLINLETLMQASNEQDELASSSVGLTVAAKQPKLEGVSSMLLARVPQSNESSLKHKQCAKPNQTKSDDQAMEFSPIIYSLIDKFQIVASRILDLLATLVSLSFFDICVFILQLLNNYYCKSIAFPAT